MSEAFAADWLALREGQDARARSAALAERLIARLPHRPRLLDLGAGTGALFRWLAPRIYRAQVWTLFDADPALIDTAFEAIALWADALQLPITTPGRALLVHAPGGAWRVEAVVGDLAELDALPLPGQHAVVNSALCDLVSAAWVEALAALLTVPFYAALMVDGQTRFMPAHPADRLVRQAFRRDQGRDKGFGPALGARAPTVLRSTFARRGFSVSTAPSDWRIGRSERAMLTALLDGYRAAATAAAPSGAGQIDLWHDARLRQIAARRLALRLGHGDLLAIPR